MQGCVRVPVVPGVAVGVAVARARPNHARIALRPAWRARTAPRVRAEPTNAGLEETAAMDALIDRMAAAKGQDELAKIVGENILSFDQRMWMRFAIRADSCSSDKDKQRLADLSRACMLLVEAMVTAAESRMQSGTKVLQEILVAAADERGEWQLPLRKPQVEAMRQAVEARASHINEELLASAYASMRKATDDNMAGVVTLVQCFLQIYAGRELSRVDAGGDATEAFLNKALQSPESEWMSLIKTAAESGDVSEVSVMESVQRRMEGTVLNLPSGSYAQRVQAEFLKEFEGRAKEAFRELVR